ncbi:MAG: GSCFA domain-containing protein [Rhodobacteraceae bacterium]|nr:GSCFA domain-containing protein [Paracoccaceae bacterium]
MTHPYADLGPEAYWKTAVADKGAFGLSGLWTPKFRIRPNDKIVTFGSCFAQHFGKALAARGYSWHNCEPPPPYISDEVARDFGYGVFSVRTGNIYTPAMLLQWLQRAYGEVEERDELWEQDGRWYDPLRPAIEPNGFASEQEVWDARDRSYAALRNAVSDASVFVFTLGLTECWRNRTTGLEYAICPGTAAGQFDEEQHTFMNTSQRMTLRYLENAIRLLRRHNRRLRILLTVSPVPLTATASGQHVLVATQYSKSVLRASAGIVAAENEAVDYFPSFEIITHPIFRGMFFAPNMRSVEPQGVQTVMSHFFADQARVFGAEKAKPAQAAAPETVPVAEEDLRCEEELLNAFAR